MIKLQKYPKQSYGSYAWHIVSLCSRSVRSFNQIALTVFNLQSGQKVAFSYVTRRIIWKINMQELWFLCMARCLNVLYKCMKFAWNISNSYQAIEWTQFCDRQMEARGKTICLPTLPGWRHNKSEQTWNLDGLFVRVRALILDPRWFNTVNAVCTNISSWLNFTKKWNMSECEVWNFMMNSVRSKIYKGSEF